MGSGYVASNADVKAANRAAIQRASILMAGHAKAEGDQRLWLQRLWRQRPGARIQDLLFPPLCLFCLDSLEANASAGDAAFCPPCRDALLEREHWDACPCCAAVRLEGRCPHCRTRDYAFDAAFALGLYEGALKEAVLRTKQRRFESLALGLGSLVGERLQHAAGGSPGRRLASQMAEPRHPPVLVFVASHWLRRWHRGVQGAELLCEGLSRRLKLPRVAGLRAIRRTRKQGTLSVPKRFQNVRGVFRASKRYDFHGTHVLLVDDVMTTGATASEAAKVLKQRGAARVTVVVLARGAGQTTATPS